MRLSIFCGGNVADVLLKVDQGALELAGCDAVCRFHATCGVQDGGEPGRGPWTEAPERVRQSVNPAMVRGLALLVMEKVGIDDIIAHKKVEVIAADASPRIGNPEAPVQRLSIADSASSR